MKRYLSPYIVEDLKNKMVFIGGPRQVGKTTLAEDIIQNNFESFEGFNWDYAADQKKILSYEFSPDSEILFRNQSI